MTLRGSRLVGLMLAVTLAGAASLAVPTAAAAATAPRDAATGLPTGKRQH